MNVFLRLLKFPYNTLDFDENKLSENNILPKITSIEKAIFDKNFGTYYDLNKSNGFYI